MGSVNSTFTLRTRGIAWNSDGTQTVFPHSLTEGVVVSVAAGKISSYKYRILVGNNATSQLDVYAQFPNISPATGEILYKEKKTASNPNPSKFIRGYQVGGLLLAAPYTAPSTLSAAEASAIRNLYQRINSLNHQFQGGVFLGEIHQTVKLMLHPTSNLLKLARSFVSTQKQKIAQSTRRRQPPRAIRKQLADDYLQWTFGVVPLMNDIKDISATLQRLANDPPRTRFVVHGQAESASFATPGTLSEGPVGFYRKRITLLRSHVKYYGAFRGMKRDPGILSGIGRIATMSGFDLRSFVPTVWNLIPYSFIADYALNIGDVLEAMCTDTSAVEWISRTSVDEAVTTDSVFHDPTNFIPDPAAYEVLSNSGSTGTSTGTIRTITRRALLQVPVLQLRSNLSNSPGKHVANLVALVLGKK